VVETRLEESEWRRRLESRSPTESAHKIRGWERMQQQLQGYNDCWQYPIAPAHHLVVDTQRPLCQLLAEVEVRMQEGPEREGKPIEPRCTLFS
jgi:hypothetical protein